MARNYQTASAQYLEDTMYRPPWEMLMAASAKQDSEVGKLVDELALFSDLDFKFWDTEKDKETAMAEKEYWDTQGEEATKLLQQDIFNPEARSKIRSLGKELQKSYREGTIHKLEANALANLEFEEKLNALTNPHDREMQRKGMIEEYWANNPEGALSSTFKPGELYEDKQLFNKFAEYWSTLRPNSHKSVIDKVNGYWVVKNTNSKEGREMMNEFKNWIGAQTDLEGYFDNREKYYGQKYRNETGQLEFDKPGYVLSNLNKAAKDLSYRSVTQGRELSPNQVQMHFDSQRSREGTDPAIATAKKGMNLLSSNKGLQKTVNGLLEGIFKKHGGSHLLSTQSAIDLARQLVNSPMPAGGAGPLRKALSEVLETYDDNVVASRKDFEDVYGTATSDRFFSSVETHTNINTPMYFINQKTGKLNSDAKPLRTITEWDGYIVDPNLTQFVDKSSLAITYGTKNPEDDFVYMGATIFPYELIDKNQPDNSNNRRYIGPVDLETYKEADYYMGMLR